MFSVHSVVFFVSLALTTARGQGSVIVEDDDALLSYTNAFKWGFYQNPQALPGGTVDNTYWHGGSGRAISLPGSSVSLVFNGSRIAYYGDLNSDHGTIEVDLDGQKTLVDAYRGAGAASQVKLFEGSVDPNQPNHRITLTCVERRGMSFDYFEYTRAVPATEAAPESTQSTPASEPTSPTAPASTLSSSSNNNHTPVIVAAVLAGLGWCTVIGLAFLLFRFRRQSRKDATAVPSGVFPVSGALSFTSSSSPGMAEARPWPLSGRMSGVTSFSPDVTSIQTSPTVLSSVPATFSASREKRAAAQADPPAYA